MRSVIFEYARALLRYFALLSVRSGFLYSILLHLFVLGIAFSDVSFLRRDAPILSTPIAVELVTISKQTNLPKPKVKPKPRPKREAVVKKAEPKKIAKLKDAIPLPEPPKPKPVKKPEVAKVKPQPKPKPPKEEKKSKFDLTRIAALINKEKKERSEVKPELEPDQPEPKQVPTNNTARLRDAPLTISEKDAIRMQIQRCWSLPAGASEAEGLVVKIRLFLRPDGSLSRPPEIVDADRMTRQGEEYFRAAAESAVRAVHKCESLRMPATKYESWREMVLTFDPSEMLGG